MNSSVLIFQINRCFSLSCIPPQASFAHSGVTVPLYDTLGPETIKFVVQQTDLTTVVCGGAAELQKLVTISGAGLCPTLKVRAKGIVGERTPRLLLAGTPIPPAIVLAQLIFLCEAGCILQLMVGFPCEKIPRSVVGGGGGGIGENVATNKGEGVYVGVFCPNVLLGVFLLSASTAAVCMRYFVRFFRRIYV